MAKRTRATALGPTPERLAKGDVRSYVPRDHTHAKDRDLAPSFEVIQRRDNPLAALSHVLSHDEMNAGYRFGRAYEKTQKTSGAINLDSNGGGFHGGLTFAMCEALGDFGQMCRALSEDPEERLRRSTLLVRVCGERRSLSELFPNKGRSLATAKHMLIASLQRLVKVT